MKRGYTIIEVIITLAIAGIICSFIFTGIGGCGQDWEAAESSAKEFCSNIPDWSDKLQCAHKDTDGDGYCGCTCFLKDGSRVKLDCGCEKWGCNKARGCKEIETIKYRGGGGDKSTPPIQIKP